MWLTQNDGSVACRPFYLGQWLSIACAVGGRKSSFKTGVGVSACGCSSSVVAVGGEKGILGRSNCPFWRLFLPSWITAVGRRPALRMFVISPMGLKRPLGVPLAELCACWEGQLLSERVRARGRSFSCALSENPVLFVANPGVGSSGKFVHFSIMSEGRLPSPNLHCHLVSDQACNAASTASRSYGNRREA
jgi:hypothetical protein